MKIDNCIKLYNEIHFADIREILAELDIYTLVSYKDSVLEMCSEALIKQQMDDAKYYQCFAHLLELNIMTHKVEEIL